ncbi:MAG TPA: TIM barrel protein [Candidatus Omnitrophota bacterium]|nr:TIM barrel protein [Candidatus Omnitrophota bacterium]HRZ14848.1 TIM barrel protein [Candidatus Omnitrophota bacterium]
MPCAISTSWNAFRHTDGEQLIRELQELGFTAVELSFNLTSEMVAAIERLVARQVISVCSLHNFCPIPEGVPRHEALPDYYSLASLDTEERLRAVKQTKLTIDAACRIGARAVVIHSGRVEIQDRTRALCELYTRGGTQTRQFQDLRDEMRRERAQLKQSFLDSALRSLDELNAYACQRRMNLGIETRFYYREIPFLDEVGMILDAFKDSRVFYWHDTGHAQLMEHLGLIDRQETYLDRYAQRLLGMHLHDIRGCADHQPPPGGDIDFKRFRPYLNHQTLKVIEVHHPATAVQVQQSKRYVEEVFDGTV